MSSQDWKSILAEVAPTIATALGGPFAGTAVKFLEDKFLPGTNPSADQLQQTVANATPDQLVKLREIDADFKKTMADIGLREEQLAAQDTADARDMAVKTTLIPQIIIGVIFVVSFFYIFISLMNRSIIIPDAGTNKDVIMICVGLIIREVTTVLQFFMGSSAGSKDKSKQIDNLTSQ